MTMTRSEAKLLVAGIRVLSHRLERAPTPEEVAEILDMGASPVRLHLTSLADLGAVALVTSAFETHAEIRDEALLEELPEEDGPAISDDLKAFDERKREESERMSQLFADGEPDARKQEKHRRMDEDLQSFRRKKPANPFDD